MLRVHGFYGHVRRNDLRSLAMFAGFAVAFQIVAAVTLFVPLLFLDLKHLPFFSLGYVERYAPIVFVLGLVLFLHRFLRHVASVRATVAFTDVDRRTDPRLVNIVETAAIAAGLPLPKVGRIETSALNAFACGLSASTAVVVVTRGLEEALDDDELAAVVAHEIAHIKNGDIRLMAAANVLMEILVLVQRRNVLGGVGWKKALVLVFMPALLLVFGAAGVATRVAFTIARVSRLLISSSREFVADAEAVRLTHNPAALISALRRIEGRSAVPGLSAQADAMMIDGAVEGPLASHPSIAERIAVLTRLSGDLVPAARPSPDTRPSPWTARAARPLGWAACSGRGGAGPLPRSAGQRRGDGEHLRPDPGCAARHDDRHDPHGGHDLLDHVQAREAGPALGPQHRPHGRERGAADPQWPGGVSWRRQYGRHAAGRSTAPRGDGPGRRAVLCDRTL